MKKRGMSEAGGYRKAPVGGRGGTAGRAAGEAIEAEIIRRARSGDLEGAARLESERMLAAVRERAARHHDGGVGGDRPIDVVDGPFAGLFEDDDPARDAVLAAMLDACPVPSIEDIDEWRSKHPRYAREILLYGMDVMWTAFEGASPRAPSVAALVAALERVVRTARRGRTRRAAVPER